MSGRANGIAQPRPMLGRLPWLAFERRILALRFLVFFDMGSEPIGKDHRLTPECERPTRQSVLRACGSM